MNEARGEGRVPEEEASKGEDSPQGSKAPEDRSNRPIADLERGMKEIVGGSDEDLAEMLAANWQRIVGGLVLALVGVWMFNQYRSAVASKKQAASEQFYEMQSTFSELQLSDSAAEDANELTKSFEEQQRLLRSSNESPMLSSFAELYRAQMLISQKEFEQAKAVLAPFLEAPASSSSRSSAEGIRSSLAQLIWARALTMQEQQPQARALLIETVRSGGIASVEAAVTLASLSKTPEQRAEVETLVSNTAASYPELREAFNQHLAPFGMSFE